MVKRISHNSVYCITDHDIRGGMCPVCPTPGSDTNTSATNASPTPDPK
jgi:hypothetical protein